MPPLLASDYDERTMRFCDTDSNQASANFQSFNRPDN